MEFDKHIPTDQLKPNIKYFVVSENELGNEYKISPSSALVIGFQYQGQLSTIKDGLVLKHIRNLSGTESATTRATNKKTIAGTPHRTCTPA